MLSFTKHNKHNTTSTNVLLRPENGHVHYTRVINSKLYKLTTIKTTVGSFAKATNTIVEFSNDDFILIADPEDDLD